MTVTGGRTVVVAGFKTQEDFEKYLAVMNGRYFVDNYTTKRFDDSYSYIAFAYERAKNPLMRVPMKFLVYSVRAYVASLIDAAIIYAAQSVELLLYRRAMKIYGDAKLTELSKKRKIGFWWLIHGAGILDNEDTRAADNIRLMRDCTVHYQNQLMFPGLGPLRFDLNMATTMSDRHALERLNLALERLDHDFLKENEDIYPHSRLLLNSKQFEFLQNRLRSLISAKIFDKALLVKKEGGNVEDEVRYLIERHDALGMFAWVKSILEKDKYYVD